MDNNQLIELNFSEWLFSEIGHLKIDRETTIMLPDDKGDPVEFDVSYIDPMFELYKPIGRWRGLPIPWNQIVSLRGLGWQAPLPYNRGLFLVSRPGQQYAKIDSDQRIPTIPSNWFKFADFADSKGNIVYNFRRKIFKQYV